MSDGSLPESHFYPGPNRWARTGGLLFRLRHDQLTPIARESNKLVEALLQLPVARSMTFHVDVNDLEIDRSKHIAAVIMTAIVEDFCITPTSLSWLLTEDEHVVGFLPCECEHVGLRAVHFLLWLSNYWETATETASFFKNPLDSYSKEVEEILGAYKTARADMRRHGLNQSSIAVGRAAFARGIPVTRLLDGDRILLQLGYGRYRQLTRETATSRTPFVQAMVAADKFKTKQLLLKHRLPVPQGRLAGNQEELRHATRALGYPVVIKALRGGKGKRVVVGVCSDDEARAAVLKVADGAPVLVEQFIPGPEFRFLVVGGRCVAVARRNPAAVIGDGASSIKQLIEALNQDPERGMHFERLREQVIITEEVLALIKKQGFSLDSVPAEREQVQLSRTSNISQGGTSDDVTDIVHSQNLQMAERAVRLAGIDVCGLDFICADITKPFHVQRSGILELNVTPGLRPHIGANPKRDVAGAIVGMLFPNSRILDEEAIHLAPHSKHVRESHDAGVQTVERGRVPIVAVTGSLGKTTTVNLINAVMTSKFACVARCTTQGAWVGSSRIRKGDVAGGKMARVLLEDTDVDAGVFELARGGLIRSGTVIDSVNVGVLLNVLDNHLGLNGIPNRQNLLHVKRQVIDIATDLAILNADDPLCMSLARSATARHLGLISLDIKNPFISNHANSGGLTGVVSGDGQLLVLQKKRQIFSVELADFPVSLGGHFQGVALSLLAAMLVGVQFDISAEAIIGALRGFQGNAEDNPMRNNLTHGHPYSLLESHCDGPEAIEELAKTAKSLCKGERRLVHCSAGNRRDEFIIAMGRAAAGFFHKYILTDWHDLRGRQPGETPALLRQGLIEAGVAEQQISIASDQRSAVRDAAAGLSINDLLCQNLG